MSISTRRGARDPKKLWFLKYYYILKWESTFTLELNDAKNTGNKYSLNDCFFNEKYQPETVSFIEISRN